MSTDYPRFLFHKSYRQTGQFAVVEDAAAEAELGAAFSRTIPPAEEEQHEEEPDEDDDGAAPESDDEPEDPPASDAAAPSASPRKAPRERVRKPATARGKHK